MEALEPDNRQEAHKEVRLDLFPKRLGLDRGRPYWVEVAWYLTKMLFFVNPIPYPHSLRKRLLVLFGAKVGAGFVMMPQVNIHMPWKLVIGDHCWIGYGCQILNFEPVVFENHVALAHQVYVAAANHDYKDHRMPYRNAPITICRGSWIGTRAFIGPGVTIGEHSVVTACSVATKSVPPWSVVRGNPAVVVGNRKLER